MPTRRTRDPGRTFRARRPLPTATAPQASLFGQRIATGPVVIDRASCSMSATSAYDEGAKTVMPGTFVSSIMSSTP